MFGLFKNEESRSNYESIKRNHFEAVYLIFPCITLLVNLMVQVYLNWTKKQMNEAAQIFVVYNADNVSARTETFSFSISHVMAIPALILTSFFLSFAGRKHRLFFLSPFYLFLVSVALPLLIIFNSPKIQKNFQKKYDVFYSRTFIMVQNTF
jgi:hypothetical protein